MLQKEYPLSLGNRTATIHSLHSVPPLTKAGTHSRGGAPRQSICLALIRLWLCSPTPNNTGLWWCGPSQHFLLETLSGSRLSSATQGRPGPAWVLETCHVNSFPVEEGKFETQLLLQQTGHSLSSLEAHHLCPVLSWGGRAPCPECKCLSLCRKCLSL